MSAGDVLARNLSRDRARKYAAYLRGAEAQRRGLPREEPAEGTPERQWWDRDPAEWRHGWDFAAKPTASRNRNLEMVRALLASLERIGKDETVTRATPNLSRADLALWWARHIRREWRFFDLVQPLFPEPGPSPEDLDRLEAHLANHLERALEDFR